ncbi:nucleolar protein 6-like [Rhopilema esculentum]|uniref:nucleolar protein 6-like n=1 Tax=Rhopilema esculentum TaxID=499914 RepID=UPI0031D5F3A0
MGKMTKRKQNESGWKSVEKGNENESLNSNGTIPEKKLKSEEKLVTSKEERERFQHSLYRPPTSDELNDLRETEDLYKNNIFRMQISYLLEEVKMTDKKSSSVEEFLRLLHKYLNNLDSTEKFDISDHSWMHENIKVPIPDLPSKIQKGKIQFGKPSCIKVIGSYLLKTATKPNYAIDIGVGMPEESMQAKDNLNFRYHTKRAMYLAFLASHLQKWSEVATISYSRIQNQPFRPVLCLKPAGKAGKKYTIKIHPMLPENMFKLSRFAPLKNNVRLSWYNGKTLEDPNADFGFPTPKYNASVLCDMLYENHLTTLYEATASCEGLKDAIPLLKVWLKQRGLIEGESCFNGFQMSMLLSYLLQKKKISPHMSALQIIRVALQYLATCDWATKGISLAENDDNNSLPDLTEFHSVYDVVFVDPSGYLNLCSNMRKSTFRLLQLHAKLAIEALQDRVVNNFDSLFMKPTKFEEFYDHWFRFIDANALKGLAKKESLKAQLVDSGGDWLPVVLASIVPKLVQGLGNKIQDLQIKQQCAQEWTVDVAPPQSSITDATIGFLIDPDHAENIIDIGPPADDPKAKEFRTFWGAKSDLRRFKDGSINEAVLWEASNKAEKRLVCKQIVEFLLQRFFKIPPLAIEYFADQLDSLVRPNYVIDDEETPKGKQEAKHYLTSTGEEESLKVLYALDELSKMIRNLKDLPLDVNSIQGARPPSRLTEVFPPRPTPRKDKQKSTFSVPSTDSRTFWSPAIEVVLQFEGSGKWPDDIEATQYVKAAFYIKLATLLSSAYSLPAHANSQYVDVMHNGFVFRVKIFYPREIQLCKQSKEGDGVSSRKEYDKFARSLDVNMVKRPLHTTMIHSLNQKFSAYAMTTRLSLRWVSSQMLSCYLTEEAVELIVASLFLKPMPHKPPSCHLSGFLRFLTLVSTHDWQSEPVIVDLNETMTADDHVEIRDHFAAQRQQLPPVFISTPYDKENSVWTKDSITNPTLARLVALAKVSREIMDAELQNPVNLKQIFRPPLDDYNVLIELDPQLLPRHYQAVDTSVMLKPPKPKTVVHKALPVVNFDPAMIYLEELRSSFSEIALFFYDQHGSTVIGVVWKPDAFTPQEFKILALKYRMPSLQQPEGKPSTKQYMVPKIDAILDDFRVIGRGIVCNVKVKDS